jgi:hypothetical protein
MKEKHDQRASDIEFKRGHDQRASDIEFKRGQYVLLKQDHIAPGQKKKLEAKWSVLLSSFCLD